MSVEPPCPQCVFVSRQLGQPMQCLLHLSLGTDAEEPSAPRDATYDEPYTYGQLRLSVDRPGPFSLREYVRLQLLRTRVQADPSPVDASIPRAHASSLARR